MKLFEKKFTIHVANTLSDEECEKACEELNDIFWKDEDAVRDAIQASSVSKLNGFRIEVDG